MESTKKNIIYNTVYQILIIFIPLITAPYISRILGADGIGIFSYTHSIANYFLLFAMLGITNYGNKTIAKVKENKAELSRKFCSIYTMQFITALMVSIAYIIFVLIFENEYKTIALLQLIFVLSAIFDINWFFFGIGKFKLTVIRNTAIKILTLIAIFAFVHTKKDIGNYTLIMVSGTLISQIIMWFYLKKQITFIKPNWEEVKSHIKPNLILFVPVIAYSIYKIMDKIMLGNITSVHEVGLYENAEKIINIPQGIISAFGTVMLSKMSSLFAQNKKEESKAIINVSMKYLTIIACAMTFGLMAVAQTFAPIYFGEEFKVTGNIICLMSCIIIFISWANVIRTQYLIPNNKDKLYMTSTVIGAVINFILNMLLIPKLTVYGAAIGTIVAEFSVMFIQLVGVRKELEIKQYLKNAIPFLIIGGIMFFVVIGIKNLLSYSIISLLIQILVGGIIYLTLTIGWLYYKKDRILIGELNKMKNKLRKVRND